VAVWFWLAVGCRTMLPPPLLLLLLLLLLVPSTAVGVATPLPRVLIFSLGDDYGFNNVGYPHGPHGYANPEAKTPNLDELAMGGIRLERHYVFKYCSPTRSSFLTGRLPVHVNQNNHCNDEDSPSGADLRMTTLPSKLQRYAVLWACPAPCLVLTPLAAEHCGRPSAGWYTAMVGKWHCGARSLGNLPINRGFDFHVGFLKVRTCLRAHFCFCFW
jgi:arylsulfatase B